MARITSRVAGRASHFSAVHSPRFHKRAEDSPNPCNSEVPQGKTGTLLVEMQTGPAQVSASRRMTIRVSFWSVWGKEEASLQDIDTGLQGQLSVSQANFGASGPGKQTHCRELSLAVKFPF